MNKFVRVALGQCSAKQMLSSRTHKPDYKQNIHAIVYFKNISS